MSLWKWVLFVAVPVALLAAHLVASSLLEGDVKKWYLSELGPTENLTFLALVAAGIWAIMLFRRARKHIPRLRWLLIAFALASLFIAMEEISYGQHHLGFKPPQWVMEKNKQRELNLHNLGSDRMSRVLRRAAELGLPIFGIVMPLGLTRIPTTYRRGDWTYYFLPKHELILVLSLCLLIRINHDLDDAIFGSLTDGLGELQEVYWALAGLFWIMIVNERLRALNEVSGETPLSPAHQRP